MAKPYGHQYFFAGSGNACGTMVCAKCNQPVFNHAHDWMAYKKPTRFDWGYVCFHRKCADSQAGWEKIERARKAVDETHDARMISLRRVAGEIGVTCAIDFAQLAAEALGEGDLDGHYFNQFGSS